MLFRRKMTTLRSKEITEYYKLALGRSLDRALGLWIGDVTVFTMLIIFYYVHGTLEWPLMFSTLEIMMSLRMSTLLLIMGVSFYYEVKVVFERFASIFNI